MQYHSFKPSYNNTHLVADWLVNRITRLRLCGLIPKAVPGVGRVIPTSDVKRCRPPHLHISACSRKINYNTQMLTVESKLSLTRRQVFATF